MGESAESGGGHQSGVQHHQRSGDRAVQHDELPWGVRRPAHRRTRPLWHTDWTGHRRHWSGGAGSQTRTSTCRSAPRTREGRIDMLSGFVQDSWRLTPALTLNAGLRYDLQLPFTPVNDIMSTVTMESVCGISGVGTGRKLRQLQLPAAGFAPGRHARVHPVDEGHAGIRHRLEQLLAERRRRLAAERRERLDAEDPRRSGAGDAACRLLGRLRASGHGRVHRAYSASTRAAR